MIRLTAAEKALIGRMAGDLIRREAVNNESDAIRSLIGTYALRDVAIYAGDALDLARKMIKGAA